MRRWIVAVVGTAECMRDDPCWTLAFSLGKELVGLGMRILTGGLNGVMEAALAGARSSPAYTEGDTLAILPGFSPEQANPYADIVVATGADVHMNGIVASCDAVIAVGGGAGTLCEIAMALERERPVLICSAVDGSGPLALACGEAAGFGSYLHPFSTVAEATTLLGQFWKEVKSCEEE